MLGIGWVQRSGPLSLGQVSVEFSPTETQSVLAFISNLVT